MSHSDEALGSAAQEAGRLLDTLREWLDSRGASAPPIATGSTECRACPICLALSAVRNHNPAVVQHLGNAAEALVSAVRELIAEHEHEWVAGRRPDVERIDIDE